MNVTAAAKKLSAVHTLTAENDSDCCIDTRTCVSSVTHNSTRHTRHGCCTAPAAAAVARERSDRTSYCITWYAFKT